MSICKNSEFVSELINHLVDLHIIIHYPLRVSDYFFKIF